MNDATRQPLRLVPAPKRCAYPDCVCGHVPDPSVWPGDLGYGSAICLSLHDLDRSAAETIKRMYDLVGGLGFGS